jgi:predicted permease
MLLKDIRYAWRALANAPGFSAIAVACLALGIGINTTIFSVVDGALLQPYPYPDAGRLVVAEGRSFRRHVNRAPISYPGFLDVRDQAAAFASVAAFGRRSLTISDGTREPERYPGAAISWNLFEMLGTPPVAGRAFAADDDRPGAAPVVILGYEVWQTRYAGDPSVVGRSIAIDGRPHTVVGVMPPRFAFPESQRGWVPLAPAAEKSGRGERWLQAFARLRPGVTVEQAAAELSGIASRSAAAHAEDADWTLALRLLKDWMLPAQPRLVILTMMGAVTLVLLIACSNVANLLLARASARQREISIRAALGAGRWRIVAQLLTEAVMIGLWSAPLGVLVAWAGLQLLNSTIPPGSVPYYIEWSINTRSLLYTAGISMLTGIVFGVVPALQATGANLQDSLRDGGRGAAGERRAWIRNALVVGQVALSLVLLIGSALFIRSFLNVQGQGVGFDTRPLLSMRFYMAGDGYASAGARAQRVEDVLRRVQALPGVEAAFASGFVPLGDGGSGARVVADGRPAAPGDERQVEIVAATAGLRQTIGVNLLRGRDVTDAEAAAGTPVALINQAMARTFWPGDDPVGRRFRRQADGQPEWFTVVGVVADFRHYVGNGDEAIAPAAYVPYGFEPAASTGITVRTAGDPAALTAALREQIRLSDAGLAVFQAFTAEELRQLSFWQYRLFGLMFFLFGAIALLLASIGVYGVLAYAVSQRTREIGVRVALGANPRDVLALVVGQGLRLAALGIVLGVLGAMAITPAVRTVLYNVTPTDPVSFGAVAMFLFGVAMFASYIPARRAMSVDPIIAIRNE